MKAKLLRRLSHQLSPDNGRNGWDTGWKEEAAGPPFLPQIASTTGVLSFPLLNKPILVPA